MLRTILILLFTTGFTVCLAQHPFNYGKSKQAWFFSKKEITRSGIKELVMPGIPANGQNNDEAELMIINYSDTNYISDGWFPYYGTSRKKLTIRQLRDSSEFMNGSFYQLENGKILSGGMEGRGSLCQDEYEHDTYYTLAVEYCKQAPTTTARKIYYYPNGLPRFTVCCKTDSSNVEYESAVDYAPATDSILTDTVTVTAEEEPYNSFFKQHDRPWHYTDTTWYVYDKKWRILGTRNKREGFIDIFKPAYRFVEQWYINNTRFETFIDKNIGYRPKMILFEIYRNAVFIFRYDTQKNQYCYTGPVELE